MHFLSRPNLRFSSCIYKSPDFENFIKFWISLSPLSHVLIFVFCIFFLRFTLVLLIIPLYENVQNISVTKIGTLVFFLFYCNSSYKFIFYTLVFFHIFDDIFCSIFRTIIIMYYISVKCIFCYIFSCYFVLHFLVSLVFMFFFVYL